MATIAALDVELSANSAAFAKDMNRAERAVKSNSAKMNRSLARLRKGFARAQKSLAAFAKRALSGRAAIGILAGSAGIGLLIKRSVSAADTIAKVAAKIGLSTDELQEFRFAAELSGVATKTMDLALQRFSRRVAEAVRGKGELKDTLLQYNVSITDAQGKTRRLADIIGSYADAIKKAESSQEKLRLAFKGFDSEGAAVVNTLRRGKAGLDKMRQSARDLGLVLERELVRGAARMKDQLFIASRVISVNLNRALLTLSPLLIDMAVRFAEAAPVIARWTRSIVGIKSIEDVRAEIQRLNAVLRSNELSWEKASRAKDGYEMGLAEQGIFDTEKQLRAANEQLKIMERRAAIIAKAISTAGAVNQKIIDVPTRRLAQPVFNLDERGQPLFFDEDAAQRKADRLVAEYDRIVAKQEEIRDLGRQIGFTFSSAFEDAAFGAGKLQDKLKDLIAELARLALRALVFDKIGGIISSGIGSLAGPTPTGPAADSPAGGAAAARRRHGGPVSPFRAFSVGEAGPEIFVPRRAGNIVPHGAGGGTVVNIIDQRGGGEPARVERARGVDGRDVVRVIVRDAVNRGLREGDFDDSLFEFGLRRGQFG